MRKKLGLLNLILIAVVVLAGRQLYDMRKAAKAREDKVKQAAVKPQPAPPVTPSPVAPPVQASGYLDVAQQTLFSKDRNPAIVVEAEKPPVPPPFPRFYGVMNLGDGLIAILSEGPGKQRPFKVGDKNGELLLTEIGTDALVFEWNKQKLTKKFSELQAKGSDVATAPEAAVAARPATPSPQQLAATSPSTPGPGIDIGAGISACNANDTSPAGTVVGGKKKIVSQSPFGGKVCRWEPVQ